MVPTAFLLAIDQRTLAGDSVWSKPLKFQFSIAVHLFTLAGLMVLLPKVERASSLTRVLVGVMLVNSAFEIS